MRLLLTGVTLLIALVLLAPVGDAFAPKLNYTTGSVQFRDWSAMHHQRHGRPTSTVAEVRIWTGGSQDVTIGTFRSGRTVRYVYSPATDVSQPTRLPPSGSLSDNSFVNIRNVASMAVGDVKITRALLQYGRGPASAGWERPIPELVRRRILLTGHKPS